jgi:hypothetical protein
LPLVKNSKKTPSIFQGHLTFLLEKGSNITNIIPRKKLPGKFLPFLDKEIRKFLFFLV